MQLLMMDMMVDMRGTSLAHQSARCARVFKASVYCLYHGGLLAPQDGAAQARQLVVALARRAGQRSSADCSTAAETLPICNRALVNFGEIARDQRTAVLIL